MDKEIIALTERHGYEFSTVTYRAELHRIKDCFDKAVDFYRNEAEFANAFDLSSYDCEAYA